MRKNKFEVTDEQVRQRGEDCETFSAEYWHSMTPAQQEELIRVRERSVAYAASQVMENEDEAGIRVVMDELRSMKSQNDEPTRDIYFAISDETLRIKAISDLFYYEGSRKRHDAAMAVEAYYRYDDIQGKLISGWTSWPEFKKLVVTVVVLDVVVFLARLVWPEIKGSADWFIGISAALVFLYYVSLASYLRHMERHHFVLWEMEKLRRGIHEPEPIPPLNSYELFSKEERQSGRRSVPREVLW